jgi:hypothetical protein
MKIHNKYFVFAFFRVNYFTGILTELIFNTLKLFQYFKLKVKTQFLFFLFRRVRLLQIMFCGLMGFRCVVC